jgi:Putative Actinobacterial Holin-X, holin superfamily III
METRVDTESEAANVSSLVSGIIHDARQLLIQQLTLFQVELKNDVRRTIAAAAPMMIGAVICVMALFMFLHAAAYFLCWIVPDMPYWIGYGAVGGTAAFVGLCLALWGAIQFQKFNPLPEKTVEGLKENFQWKTKADSSLDLNS